MLCKTFDPPDDRRAAFFFSGIVDTQMWVEVDRDLGAITNVGEGESMKAMAAGITLGRVSTGGDVAAFVSYLAGPDSDYMTGQSVLIDGGMLFV
jgi:meso-butanediol dehydrogenase / (S,S)-butanediol dehydrogenase / diacetyl reductase